MAGFSNHSVTVKVATKELVKMLRTNREKHEAVVKEARAGYITKAKTLIQARLDQLASGKIVSLSFELTPPVSMLEAYDDAIVAFEMHTEDSVEFDRGRRQPLHARQMGMEKSVPRFERSLLEARRGRGRRRRRRRVARGSESA